MTNDETPKLDRPRFHVYLVPDGADPDTADPEYVAAVTITNRDQLVAENQSRANGVDARNQPFHVTNLWIWAACVRLGLTADKFQPFTRRLEYAPIKPDAMDPAGDEPDPTLPDPDHNSGSA